MGAHLDVLDISASPGSTATMDSSGAVQKREPVFTKIDQLRPDTSGHNLVVKVSGALAPRWGVHAELWAHGVPGNQH